MFGVWYTLLFRYAYHLEQDWILARKRMGQDPTLDVQSSANVDTPDHLARQPSKTPSDLALEETSMYEYVYDTQPNTDAGTRRP